MMRALSSYVFLLQRLHAGHLDAMVAGGAQSIEVFAARHHFEYTDRGSVKEIATWFRSNDIRATLHQPIYDANTGEWSRHHQPMLNLIDVEKSRRINAMDEVKRALEAAEQVPFESIVLNLGTATDAWSERTLDLSLTAIEHIKAFAHPLGVKALVETSPYDVATPEHLLEILRVGHFDSVGVCLDIGHVNLPGCGGVEAAFALLGDRVKEVHLHDNHGQKDEHLWPGKGTIDWKLVAAGIAAIKDAPTCALEIAYEPELTSAEVTMQAAKAYALLDA